jgi:hypothetical protein
MSLAKRAKAYDPWWFCFENDGETFGGEVPRETFRTSKFFQWAQQLDVPLKTIVELGSHEGNHTLQLAAHPGVEKVIGLEGRAENVARAEFVKQVFNVPTIEFHQRNLENFDPSEWPRCDAVFCSGLLYHLPKPWELVPKIAELARTYVLIDTMYSHMPTETYERYSGQWVIEPKDDLSGLSPKSFLLSFRSLAMLMMESGLVIHYVSDYGKRQTRYRLLIIAEKTDRARWQHWGKPRQVS